ncbi:hypothetical protein GCK32_009979 [Trichostrongylus colubriformis]|uniref:Uncharacterized protein n=1 Tax=Trichostrongylus colubriformis TaxID=6319 RepID=A0AAN8FBQ2_TRICO
MCFYRKFLLCIWIYGHQTRHIFENVWRIKMCCCSLLAKTCVVLGRSGAITQQTETSIFCSWPYTADLSPTLVLYTTTNRKARLAITLHSLVINKIRMSCHENTPFECLRNN